MNEVRIVDTLTMFLIQISALIIFIESYQKRYVQIDFLRKINSIDFILEYKIGIKPDYKSRKKIYTKRLIRWIVMNITIFVIIFVFIYDLYAIVYRWYTLIYASYVICSIRCHQITNYADVIFYRYYQINQYLLDQRKRSPEIHENINIDLAKMLKVCTTFQKCKTGHIFDKLNDLQRVCRLLGSANQSINKMFQWSIPLIIINDLLQTLVNCYWILRILFSNESNKYFVAPLLWTFLNFNHFISLSSACHYAAAEVICCC